MPKEKTYQIKFDREDRKTFFGILYYVCVIIIIINLGVIIHTVSWLFYGMVGLAFFDPYYPYPYYLGYYYGLPYFISAFVRIFTSGILIIVLIFLMRYSRRRAEIKGIWGDLKQLKKDLIESE